MESRSVAAGSDVDWEQLYRQGGLPGKRVHRIRRSSSGSMKIRYLAVSWCQAAASGMMSECWRPRARMCLGGYCTLCYRGSAGVPSTRSRIIRILGDFFDRDAVDGKFDWIFEHTCFCAIPPDRRENMLRVSRVAQPRRRLRGDLLSQSGSRREGPPFGCQRMSWTRYSRPVRARQRTRRLANVSGSRRKRAPARAARCESLLFPLDGARGELSFRNGHLDEAGHGGDGSVRAF